MRNLYFSPPLLCLLTNNPPKKNLSVNAKTIQNDVKIEPYDSKKAFNNSYIKDYSELPIKPARTISFTTDEGSYMDVDISPDGKTILFDLLGDLYTVPAAGGIAKQLTRGLAINRCPIWSPDGNKIAYESDASGFIELHVINLSKFS